MKSKATSVFLIRKSQLCRQVRDVKIEGRIVGTDPHEKYFSQTNIDKKACK
jgi:hypothetical protein